MSLKQMPKKFRIIVFTSVIIALIAVIACTFLLIDKFKKTDNNNGTNNPDTTMVFNKDFSGTIITYQPESENVTDEEMNFTINMISNKLNEQGYAEATVTRSSSGQIRIMIPDIYDVNLENIEIPRKLTFKNSDDEILMEGTSKYIKRASANYDPSMGYYVLIEFTADGQQAFADATSATVGQRLHIYLGDVVQSAPLVHETINSSTCVIEGDFSAEEAKWLADTINEGLLPFSLKLISIKEIAK